MDREGGRVGWIGKKRGREGGGREGGINFVIL